MEDLLVAAAIALVFIILVYVILRALFGCTYTVVSAYNEGLIVQSSGGAILVNGVDVSTGQVTSIAANRSLRIIADGEPLPTRFWPPSAGIALHLDRRYGQSFFSLASTTEPDAQRARG